MKDELKQLWNAGSLIDPVENHRLSLIYIGSEQGGFNFHSLVLEKNNNGEWHRLKVISRKAFQASHNRERWVSGLHSFVPSTGYAILKIAEGDAPKDSSEIHYKYSWRKWDLMRNEEIEFLKDCKDPFETYEPNNNS